MCMGSHLVQGGDLDPHSAILAFNIRSKVYSEPVLLSLEIEDDMVDHSQVGHFQAKKPPPLQSTC